MQFDRLVQMVDRWAAEMNRTDVFAQIGESNYEPLHLKWTKWLSRQEYDQCIRQSTSVIAHAGTGTIIQVLSHKKPLLVVPRLSRFQETRNDHQVATAAQFASSGHLLIAHDESEFRHTVSKLEHFVSSTQINPQASRALLDRIRCFVEGRSSTQAREDTTMPETRHARNARSTAIVTAQPPRSLAKPEVQARGRQESD